MLEHSGYSVPSRKIGGLIVIDLNTSFLHARTRFGRHVAEIFFR